MRGDLAFAQSIVETGYFGFVGSIVSPANWNFAGMGACDSLQLGSRSSRARDIGVRAQIQDLRNYADPGSRAANLRNPPVPEWYAWPSLNPVDRGLQLRPLLPEGSRADLEPDGQRQPRDLAELRPRGHLRLHEHADVQRPPRRGAAAGADPVGNLELVQRTPDGRAHPGAGPSTRRRATRPRSTST